MSGNTMGTCPLGGLWYTCTAQNPTFMGCCTSNPCNGSGCPASDLRAAGMGTSSGPDFSSNDGSYWPNVQCSIGQWWTCAVQTPSFQGCCEINPCQGDNTGCPSGKLHPAAFKSVTSASAPAATITSRSSSSSQATSTTLTESTASGSSLTSSLSTSRTVLTSTLANGSPTTITTTIVQTVVAGTGPITASGPSNSNSHIGAIAGGAAGGAVLFLIIVFIIWRTCRHRKISADENDDRLASAFEGIRKPPLGYGKGDVNGEIRAVNEANSNGEAYYPGQPIFGVPSSTKITSSNPPYSPPLSPGPPPYQPQSVHEVDGRDIHEIHTPNIGGGTFQAQELHGITTGRVTEMPIVGVMGLQQGSWGERRPVGLGLGGRDGMGSPGSGRSERGGEYNGGGDEGGGMNRGSGSGSGGAGELRQSYTGYESYMP